MNLLLAKNPMDREHEVARRAMAYERINYSLLLKAMIRKYFWNCLPVPPVHFRSVEEGTLAYLGSYVDRRDRRFFGYHIVLDVRAIAEDLLESGAPLTAILAHELCHLYRQECEGLMGNHTSGFDNLCECVRDLNGCPVIDGKGAYLAPIY
jgi:hypothetical protein